MKRYHFSMMGATPTNAERGKLGIAGAIFAETDEEAIFVLQNALDHFDLNAIDNKNQRPYEQYNDRLIDYLQVCINDPITVTVEDFDEIEEVDEETGEELDIHDDGD